MELQKLAILLLCCFLGSAELLGPEKSKSKSDQEDIDLEDEKSTEDERTETDDAEFLESLKKAVEDNDFSAFNPDLKFIKFKKEKLGSSKDKDEQVEEESLLDQVANKLIGQSDLKPGWLDTILELPRNNLQVLDENPQELLDSLPPLPEEEELPLTLEQQEAKNLYEAAILKLNRRSPDVYSIIQSIKISADKGHIPAQIKMAWSYLYGEGVDIDIERGKQIFETLAKTGNPEAHSGIAFLYATGIGVPVSQSKALVHYTLGAIGESTPSQMALGYRYWNGVTVTSSCSKALDLYRKVAAKVASEVTFSGGPAVQRTRLLDEVEGNGGGSLDTDLIEYYQLLAEKGDIQAQVGLGQLHYQGGRGVTLDVTKALHYFTQASKAGNAVALAFLGKIFLEGGDGIKADNETALRYFRKAAELNNPVGQSGLGLMYLQGRGVPKDTNAALKYFTLAANQGWVDGQLHLGYMYFGGIGVRRDFKLANKYFSLASQSGHVLAFYHLAQMHAQGLGVMRSCTTAVELFKNVCERGGWGSRLMSAHAAWRAGEPDSAFLQYASLAEAGYEVAQSNAAHLLDVGEVTLFNETERYVRALQYWARAAAQGYSPARVKLGDYHYYGLGTPVDLEAAASHYRIASEQQHNAQATFNLGYMHERGLGLAQDAHLAKRCYDQAADTSPDARLPAALALLKLNLVLTINSLADSPLALIFLTGESSFLSNWDLYLITALLGALGFVVYFRRPRPQPAN